MAVGKNSAFDHLFSDLGSTDVLPLIELFVPPVLLSNLPLTAL